MSEKLERKVLRSSSHRLSSENINIDSSLQEEQSVLPSPRMRNLAAKITSKTKSFSEHKSPRDPIHPEPLNFERNKSPNRRPFNNYGLGNPNPSPRTNSSPTKEHISPNPPITKRRTNTVGSSSGMKVDIPSLQKLTSSTISSEKKATTSKLHKVTTPQKVGSALKKVSNLNKNKILEFEKDRDGLPAIFRNTEETNGTNSPVSNVEDNRSRARVNDATSKKVPLRMRSASSGPAPRKITIEKDKLSLFEQKEIQNFPDVLFVGTSTRKIKLSTTNNFGFDDEKGDYKLIMNDHVAYRYEILRLLGEGSFGRVVEVLDHKSKKNIALKIIRNKQRYHQQALVELKILKYLTKMDEDNESHIIHVLDSFTFRNHVCLTFDLMGVNLYEYLKANNYQGFDTDLLRKWGIQILKALRFLSKRKVIHCDLKPENILLELDSEENIKVIDLGSSCFEHQKMYTYIQSRFYRAPEVILGISYGPPIDMWSFGCILAELYTGYPLFPGENEVHQLACIQELLGLPLPEILNLATRKNYFYVASGKPRVIESPSGTKHEPGSKTLSELLNTNDTVFVDFISSCLTWNPKDRLTPTQAFHHKWILQEPPSEKRNSQEFYLNDNSYTSYASEYTDTIPPDEESEIRSPSPLHCSLDDDMETY